MFLYGFFKLTGISSITSDENRFPGYFCSNTIFNLGNMAHSDNEVKALGKDVDFAPVQRKINKPELRSDFGEFCYRIRICGIFVMNRH